MKVLATIRGSLVSLDICPASAGLLTFADLAAHLQTIFALGHCSSVFSTEKVFPPSQKLSEAPQGTVLMCTLEERRQKQSSGSALRIAKARNVYVSCDFSRKNEQAFEEQKDEFEEIINRLPPVKYLTSKPLTPSPLPIAQSKPQQVAEKIPQKAPELTKTASDSTRLLSVEAKLPPFRPQSEAKKVPSPPIVHKIQKSVAKNQNFAKISPKEREILDCSSDSDELETLPNLPLLNIENSLEVMARKQEEWRQIFEAGKPIFKPQEAKKEPPATFKPQEVKKEPLAPFKSEKASFAAPKKQEKAPQKILDAEGKINLNILSHAHISEMKKQLLGKKVYFRAIQGSEEAPEIGNETFATVKDVLSPSKLKVVNRETPADSEELDLNGVFSLRLEEPQSGSAGLAQKPERKKSEGEVSQEEKEAAKASKMEIEREVSFAEKIYRQVNFWFTDRNYFSDAHMQALVAQNDGKGLTFGELLEFPRLKKMEVNMEELRGALANYAHWKNCNFEISQGFVGKKKI